MSCAQGQCIRLARYLGIRDGPGQASSVGQVHKACLLVDTLDRHQRALQQVLRQGIDRAAIVGALRRFQSRVSGLKLGLGVIQLSNFVALLRLTGVLGAISALADHVLATNSDWVSAGTGSWDGLRAMGFVNMSGFADVLKGWLQEWGLDIALTPWVVEAAPCEASRLMRCADTTHPTVNSTRNWLITSIVVLM
jgi:hypothetical protein